MLENLSYEFFREFARYEYCLKAAGFLENTYSAKASWSKYAIEVTQIIDSPQSPELQEAINYFLEHPPKKQIVKDGILSWSEALPSNMSKAEIIFLLIRRVRNNLFHGGKFNGHWFEPQRSEELMKYALTILRNCRMSHRKMNEAYNGNMVEKE